MRLCPSNLRAIDAAVSLLIVPRNEAMGFLAVAHPHGLAGPGLIAVQEEVHVSRYR